MSIVRPGLCIIITLLLLAVLPAAGVATTTLVSRNSAGAVGNGSSIYPSISGNGRYVAFESWATNLVPGDTNRLVDIFVRDRQTGTTALVSKNSAGAVGNNWSFNPSISGNGRYVAFESWATNLVPGDSKDAPDIFVHDRLTGTTSLVSRNSAGAVGNGFSRDPSLSGDARYVAFKSEATNLVPGDTNGKWDIFVRDRQTGTTALVSKNPAGAGGNHDSMYPSISTDGRYVAFESAATNLVNDTNGASDIFVRDLKTGTTSRVSRNSAGMEGNGNSYNPSISGDGRYVAFKSYATNLVPGDTNGYPDIFVRDRQTGTTALVSKSSTGVKANDYPDNPSISGDGRYVAFESRATNLVPGDTNSQKDIFVHYRQTGTTSLVSRNSAGVEGTRDSEKPSISTDGRYVAFESDATNLVKGDTNGFSDIFVRDRGVPVTVTTPNGGEVWSLGSAHIITWNHELSPGTYVKIELLKAGTVVSTIYSSVAIVSGSSQSAGWIPPLTLAPGSDYKVRVTSTGSTANTDTSNSPFTLVGQSQSRIVFVSGRDNAQPYLGWEIYTMNRDGAGVHRLTSNSVQDDQPAISPDGRKIAFLSYRNGNYDIYSMNADGTGQVRLTQNASVDEAPVWSPDGRKIAFMTNRDGNFEIYTMNADGSAQTRITSNAAFDGWPDWRQIMLGSMIIFTSERDGNPEIYWMLPDGTNPVRLITNPATDETPVLSPDGSFDFAFVSNRDGNKEIYLRHLVNNILTETRLTNNPAEDSWPSWSPDGKSLVFRSSRAGNWELYRMERNGTGVTRLTTNASMDVNPDWGV